MERIHAMNGFIEFNEYVIEECYSIFCKKYLTRR